MRLQCVRTAQASQLLLYCLLCRAGKLHYLETFYRSGFATVVQPYDQHIDLVHIKQFGESVTGCLGLA